MKPKPGNITNVAFRDQSKNLQKVKPKQVLNSSEVQL